MGETEEKRRTPDKEVDRLVSCQIKLIHNKQEQTVLHITSSTKSKTKISKKEKKIIKLTNKVRQHELGTSIALVAA